MKDIKDITIYEDDEGWHWKAISANNEQFGHSEEAFSGRQAAENNLDLMARTFHALYMAMYEGGSK